MRRRYSALSLLRNMKSRDVNTVAAFEDYFRRRCFTLYIVVCLESLYFPSKQVTFYCSSTQVTELDVNRLFQYQIMMYRQVTTFTFGMIIKTQNRTFWLYYHKKELHITYTNLTRNSKSFHRHYNKLLNIIVQYTRYVVEVWKAVIN